MSLHQLSVDEESIPYLWEFLVISNVPMYHLKPQGTIHIERVLIISPKLECNGTVSLFA